MGPAPAPAPVKEPRRTWFTGPPSHADAGPRGQGNMTRSPNHAKACPLWVFPEPRALVGPEGGIWAPMLDLTVKAHAQDSPTCSAAQASPHPTCPRPTAHRPLLVDRPEDMRLWHAGPPEVPAGCRVAHLALTGHTAPAAGLQREACSPCRNGQAITECRGQPSSPRPVALALLGLSTVQSEGIAAQWGPRPELGTAHSPPLAAPGPSISSQCRACVNL